MPQYCCQRQKIFIYSGIFFANSYVDDFLKILKLQLDHDNYIRPRRNYPIKSNRRKKY